MIHTAGWHWSHFLHYPTAGVPGKHNLDNMQELNYLLILRAVTQTGYEGCVGHEVMSKRDPLATL